MKYSNTALKNLSARYGKILRKCAYLNAVVLTVAMIANPAMAERITVDTETTLENEIFSNNNNSGAQGGAIFNTSNLTISDSTFDTNSALEGGALFVGREGTTTKITNSTFSNNSAVSDVGGAITLRRGTLDLDNVTFSNNTAKFSGAIFTYSLGNSLVIKNSLFDNNTAYAAGAVQAMFETDISNTTFKNNKATSDDSDGAGALFVGAAGKTKLDTVTFENNTSGARGGAISTRSADLGNNKDARLDILNSTFTFNSAVTTGGALDNYLYSSQKDITTVYIDNSTFTSNSAANGGAIYNHGTPDLGGETATIKIANSTFTGNTATTAGGAIYNELGGTLTLSGTNVFRGNKAADKANDIHNLGTLNISGDLTLDGGITGTGSVVFEKGSTLKANLNDSPIVAGSSVTGQTALVLEGDVNGKTFKINGTEENTLAFDTNTLYDITTDASEDKGEKTWTISKKSTEAITESLTSAGASETAAQTAAAMTEAKPTTPAAAAIANAITTAAQTGDTAALAELTEKVNPTTTPVVQQQSVTMANQIFSVAGGRMGGIGRSGGDVNVTVGPWIQGLYNKTHNSQGVGFDGYSQGFALGLDFDVCKNFMWGFGYGYTATDVKSNGRKTQIYSDNIFLYGKYQPNKWYVSGIANYGHSNYKETSLGLIGKYNVDTYSATANVGYQSGLFDNYAGLRYSYITPDSYSNGLTTVDSKNSQIGTAIIGTKISKSYKTENATWKPEIRLAATYDIKSDNSSSIVGIVGGSSTYMVEGKRQKRFAVEAGAGITTTVARNLDISLNYDANLRSEQISQTGSMKLKYSF